MRLSELPRRLVVLPFRFWGTFVSPGMAPRCKYEPGCSRYATEAVLRFGILRGLVLAAWRLLRCNPWSHGGYDPVEAQRLFRTVPRAPARGAEPESVHGPP